MRDRLHAYTKRTLGAGGSINEAVRANFLARSFRGFARPLTFVFFVRSPCLLENHVLVGSLCMP